MFKTNRLFVLCSILVVLLLVSIACGIAIGPAEISVKDILRVLYSKIVLNYDISDMAKSKQNIIWFIRAPRVILAGLVGISLALSGLMMQAFTKNPLADPYILGISSGASFGAVLAIVTPSLLFLGRYRLTLGAFIGAFLCIFLVYSLSVAGEKISPISIVLVGIAISSLFGALTNFVVYSAPNDAMIREATFWMLGGFGGAKWEYLPILLISTSIVFLILMFLAIPINGILMGEKAATTIGIDVVCIRKLLILMSAVLTSTAVAVSGCIGFVGLVIPHGVRSFIGADHRKVIPLTMLCSAIIMIWFDILSRIIIAPQELPIGIITAFIGAPVFLFLIKKKRYTFGESK